jgi:tetratricopeptide (TPR) repeat protein
MSGIASSGAMNADPDPSAECVRLCAQGDYKNALRLASRTLRQHPRDARLWNAAGAAALALDLIDDAERFWRTAIAQAPDYADPIYNLGLLQFKQRKFDLAARSFARAIVLVPDHALAMNNLGTLLFEVGRIEPALTLLRRSTELDPGNAQAFNNLGLAQIEIGQLAEARIALDRAVALKPDFAEALNSRGLQAIEAGDFESAAKDFDASIAVDPGYGRAHLNRALMTSATEGAEWITLLRRAHAKRSSLSAISAETLCFAMGKVCEELGQYEAAFDAYAEANRRHYAQQPFDELRDQQMVAALIEAHQAELYATAGVAPALAATRVPIFVVGMPRSGTTLVEQILDSHPDIHGAGELMTLNELLSGIPGAVPAGPDRPQWLATLRALGEEYIQRVWQSRIGERFVVDKMPENYLHVGLIPLMFPSAKIIHVSRDPIDTCLSCFVTPFRRGHEYSYDLTMLGRRYLRYRRLMRHWQAILPPNSIHNVQYEALIASPEGEAKRLIAHIGVAWSENCVRFYENQRAVRTASFAQVRQRVYTRSIARAKRFERQLEPLRQILDSVDA